MKYLFKIVTYIFSLILLFASCYREQVILIPQTDDNLRLESILYLNSKPCFLDEKSKIISYSIEESSLHNFNPIISYSSLVKLYYSGKLVANNSEINFGNIEYKKEYSLFFVTKQDSTEIKLRFTPLTCVRISKAYPIYDEPKIPAFLQIAYPEINNANYLGYIGIEHRGATSLAYPKKSLGFNTLLNKDIKTYKMINLIANRANYNWILDAAYIDNSRVRNAVSFSIWAKISKKQNHYSLNTKPVELYINNDLQGIYFLNENFIPEILNLKTNNEVLYKAIDWYDGATKFEFTNDTTANTEYWDGWEQKYPDPKTILNWQPLKNLRNFIVNSSDKNFADSIEFYIDIDNFIDYYLFLNLISAYDNCGKNTFLMQSTQTEKFIILPWDMDGAWALFWDGTYIEPTGILTNNLYDRLFRSNPNNFKLKLKNRWLELRQNVFSYPEIISEFDDKINIIIKSGIIEKENSIWGLNINSEQEFEHIKSWISQRLYFLDNYFTEIN